MAQSDAATRLLDAVKSNDCALVRSLLGLPPPPWEQTREATAAAVVSASSSRCDPNSRDSDGSSALHWSAWVRTRPVFISLLEAGADPGAVNSRNESVLEWSLRGGDAHILAALLTLPAGSIDVRSANASGGQAVHIASEEGAVDALAALLLRGADINAKDGRGKTPLMCAAHRNKPVVRTQGFSSRIRSSATKQRCTLQQQQSPTLHCSFRFGSAVWLCAYVCRSFNG